MADDVRERGRTALLLLLGFYALSLGIVVLLIAANVVLWLDGQIYFYLLAVTVITTVTVLPAVFRLDRRASTMKREGLLPVSRTEQPDLWRLVDEIAAAAGSEPPRELLLDGAVNAAVLQTGTMMGLRPGKRYMLVGMPLLTLMNETELRAVLAHEFGHYVGGDTKVGAILYRADAGLRRVVRNVRSHTLRSLFLSYAEMFAKASFPVRRAQEYSADLLAVRATHPDAVRDALSALPGMDALWAYHRREYLVPAWELGLSVTDPFSGLTQQWEGRAELRATALARALKGTSGGFDSHPSLSERLAALPERTTDRLPERGCLHLLQQQPTVEAALRRAITPAAVRTANLKDVAFEELPDKLAHYRGDVIAREVLTCLRGLDPDRQDPHGTLSHLLDRLEALGGAGLHERVVLSRGIRDPRIARALTLGHLVHETLAAALVDQDHARYVLNFSGAEPFTVESKGTPLDLHALAAKIAAGGASTKSARTTLKRRKVDLTWGPAAPSTLGVRGLAAQIAGG